MKTYTVFEASDIRFDDKDGKGEPDPIDLFLLTQILLIKLADMSKDEEDAFMPIRKMVADFRNNLAKRGLTITKAEIPSAIRDGMSSDG